MTEHHHPSQPRPTSRATHATVGGMMITDVLELWPRTADVFHQHAMACVGCAVAPFFSITDAALVYSLSPELFIEELLAVIHETRPESNDE